MDGLKTYQVRDGRELAHDGEVLVGGAQVQLLPHIAYEVRHLVDPVGADGKVAAWGSADDEKLAADLASAKPHERISIIDAAIAAKTGDLAQLTKARDVEVRANAAAAKALEKKKPAPAATPQS